jgi:hypothetical protein
MSSTSDDKVPPVDEIGPLRVAQSELVSGDTSGKVFLRASPGAVAFLTDRSQAQAQISSQLRLALLKDTPQKVPNK